MQSKRQSRLKFRVFTLLIALLAVSADGLASPGLSPSESIRSAEMRRHVEFLAADELLGRDTGAPGVAIAERYVATAFESFGLQPLPGQEEFLVPFDLFRSGYDTSKTFVALYDADGSLKSRADAGVDSRPFNFSSSGSVEAELVFAGYGIHAPDQEWDDYAGLDVEGKVVLVLRHGPWEGDDDREISGDHQQFSAKARTAAEQGAVGMLLVTDPLHHDAGDDLRLGGRLSLSADSSAAGRGRGEQQILAVQISRPYAEQLAAGSEKELIELQRALDEGTPAAALSIANPSVNVAVAERDEPERVPARNVVGFLPGSDPTAASEWVLVGAHHDHVGGYIGEGDTVFNGADDNASGVSAILELAQAFATADPRPRRSLVFATFSAEEKGLLGSEALVRDVLETERIAFMLNLDMIGRNSGESIRVYGDGYVRGLKPLVEAASAGSELELEFAGNDYEANSDHAPFFRRDVPFMFFFTGLHEDYHGRGDHAEKLDYDRMQAIARVAYGVLERAASRETRMSFIHRIDWLGLAAEAAEGEAGSIQQVSEVESDSPADQLGLRVGDLLLGLGEESFADGSVSGMFDAVEAGETVELSWQRKKKTKRADLLRVRPGYMGVMSGELSAELRERYALSEQQGLLLQSVVPGGPSEEAGLEAGDVVLKIGGQPVNQESLRRRLSRIGAGETVAVDLIRDGERMAIDLTIGERPRR